MAAQTFIIKADPERLPDIKPYAVLNIVLMALIAEEEARTMYRFVQERKGEGPSPEPRHALPQVEEAEIAAVVRMALFNDVRAPMAHPRNEVGGLLLPERSPEHPY